MPLRAEMELTYCLGVVHHTPEPAKTFDAAGRRQARAWCGLMIWSGSTARRTTAGFTAERHAASARTGDQQAPAPDPAGISTVLALQLYSVR